MWPGVQALMDEKHMQEVADDDVSIPDELNNFFAEKRIEHNG